MTSISSPAPVTTWRGDAAGLRGVAVLAVLMFHAVPGWLPGGFAGVDIFFVLSGFLMARLIIADLAAGDFTYGAFYARRARRLFPALLLVLCATLAVAPAFLVGADMKALGMQVAASAAFVGNFLAWSQAGYFGGDAAYKPLLHLWSLGVEEQFYLVFPVCAVFVLRKSRSAAAWFLALAGGASFAACVALTGANPDAAFYLPVTRFWELLAGAGVTLAERRAMAFAPRVSTALSAVGAALIVASLVLLDDRSPFPGWRAALPVAGACLLLLAGPATWLARKALARNPLTWFGEISYAAYLWHWPLLAFAHHRIGKTLPPALALGLTACAILLAWRSTKMLETPFRTGVFSQSRLAAPGLVVALAVVATISTPIANVFRANGEFIARMEAVEANITGDIWRKSDRCFVDIYEVFDYGQACMGGPDDGRPVALVWGDSHAASLYAGLDTQAALRGYRLAQMTVTSCAPLIESTTDFNFNCKPMHERTIPAIEKLKPKMVVLAARWAAGYPEDKIYKLLGPTIAWLKSIGVERVAVIGPLPTWYPSLPNAVVSEAMKSFQMSAPDRVTSGLYENTFTMTPRLREIAQTAGADFVAPLDYLCEKRDCRIWVDPATKETLMAFDDAHLTPEGSQVVGALIGDKVFGRAAATH